MFRLFHTIFPGNSAQLLPGKLADTPLQNAGDGQFLHAQCLPIKISCLSRIGTLAGHMIKINTELQGEISGRWHPVSSTSNPGRSLRHQVHSVACSSHQHVPASLAEWTLLQKKPVISHAVPQQGGPPKKLSLEAAMEVFNNIPNFFFFLISGTEHRVLPMNRARL